MRPINNSQAKNLRLIGSVVAVMYVIYGALFSFLAILIIQSTTTKFLLVSGIALGAISAAFISFVFFNAAGELLEETKAISKSNIAIAKMLKGQK
jgi:hypothetical protein